MGLSSNGAETLVRTLVAGGVEVCFANPGTSEMQFVAALDKVPGMRCVLGLFEGVVTGAADGYARMADKPACTLLHLAPGLANGLANLHNAKRAQVPVINLVGEHRQGHKVTDSPLTGDIEALAGTMSQWVKTCTSADEIAADAAQAIREANTLPGRISTLILPADTAWSQVRHAKPLEFTAPRPTLPAPGRFDAAVKALRSGENVVMVLSGRALRAEPLAMAQRIVQRTGAHMVAQYANGRIERGAGRVAIARTPASVDAGVAFFKDARHVILIGAKVPAAMFGYPEKPDLLLPAGANLIPLTELTDDLVATLEELADRVGAKELIPVVDAPQRRDLPGGDLSADAVMQISATLMPEHSIIVDESITAGRRFFPLSTGVAQHDYLQLTGGSIGSGLPMATGAALACPQRKVINLQGDGSSMYTIQALWTQARERLNVVTIIFANRGYQVLKAELDNVGATHWGERAERMLSIVDPDINWAMLAQGMGVEAAQADTCDRFADLLRHALGRPGPFLIEAKIAGSRP
ncbi:acetolactate synthase large subunit [Variovorax sp. OV084]|jgi:acetolactate synthase-1/2/3 large subunit|uniref:acetolactate synthase large subunit n=1 Tax=Variovorax sp. OV084 TaxID=1882777 RepID=UPI0008AF54F5|nr:acetolactate synthase large subunit [Variovorax sp. OV084]SEU04453.1 acetolactate synthase-1/2/3 large subunit [Variovorax sp. OV084]